VTAGRRVVHALRLDRLGPLAALLALVGQLAAGSFWLPDDAAGQQRAAISALAVLCVGGTAPPAQPAQPAHPARSHHADPALLPPSVQFALAAALPPPRFAVPPPPARLLQIWRPGSPSRAPPVRAAGLRPPARAPPASA